MPIVRADQVFTDWDFTKDELAKIYRLAAGKTVSFPSDQGGRVDPGEWKERLLEDYGRGMKADELVGKYRCSRRTVFNVLAEERGQGVEGSRVRGWKKRGLSWREIGRIYKRSHEWARKMAESGQVTR